MVHDSPVLVSELVAALAPGVTVLAGEAGLAANVRWVHATDLADPSPYLKGEELVLTNGQWRRTPADSRRFVRLLAGAGVAALGYGLQTPGTRTPGDLVRACAAAGLPLLEIPHDMAFSEISELVANHHAEHRQRRLIRRVRRDEALLTSVTGGGGPEQILRILARDYGADFLLIDHAGQTLGGAPPPDTPASASTLAAAVAGLSEVAAIEVDGRAATAFPVTAHGGVEAFLLCFRDPRELSDDERSAIGHELVFVGLELVQALATRELAERLVDELPGLIAAGAPRSAELSGRLRSLGVDATDALSVIVVAAGRADAAHVRRVARIAIRVLAARGVPAVAPVDGACVLVIGAFGDDARALAGDLLTTLAREGVVASAGIGSAAGRSGEGLTRSTAEARVAAEYARVRPGGGGIATAAEAGSFRVLLAGLERPARVAFAQAVLGPVIAQDRARGSHLLESLDAFVRDGGHWQRVADSLHLHVNTLRYRIGRVEQLTGRSLSSFEERVNVYLALEALRDGPGTDLEDPPS
jgi:DNA-binding PucR family transcriptional regulator